MAFPYKVWGACFMTVFSVMAGWISETSQELACIILPGLTITCTTRSLCAMGVHHPYL